MLDVVVLYLCLRMHLVMACTSSISFLALLVVKTLWTQYLVNLEPQCI